MKIFKRNSPEAKPKLLKRVIRFFVRIIIAIPVFIVLALFSLSLINPPFSLQMAKSFINHGNINHEWIDYQNLPENFGLFFLAIEDEHFCTHWGFALRTSRDREVGKPTTLTQKAVRVLFLGSSEGTLRRVFETPLTVLIEILLTKQRILELYLNHVKVGTSIFGVASASQTILGKNITTLSPEESAILTVMLEDPNGINPNNLSPEQNIRIEWIVERAKALKSVGLGSCLRVS